MKLKKSILIITALLIFSFSVFADSPLTSTDFSAAYSAEPIVIAASNTNGVLTEELMDYLTDKNNPVDLKMAVINKLGWNIAGKNNSQIFMNYLMKKYRFNNAEKFPKKAKGDDLLAMAYLKALDNYFKVDAAVELAEKALKKNKKSRTYNLIAGLIKAQKAFDGNWCEVFQITDRVRKNEKLKNDIKPEAVKIIYDYMDIYGDECK